MTKKKYYTNKKGEKVFLTTSLLEKAVALKLEFQKVNGNCKWSTVARILRQDGYDGVDNSEGFRVAVREYQRKIGKLPTVKQYKDKNIENKMRLLREQLGELSLAKRDLQIMKRDYNKIKRELNDRFLFREELINSIADGVEVSPSNIEPYCLENVHGAMVVICTDWHTGACFDIHTNKYNLSIETRLIEEYSAKVAKQIVAYKPSKVFIYNLGDDIEGTSLRVNQPYSIEFGLGEQIRNASKLQSSFVYALASKFPDVNFEFSAIVGNHSRFAPNAKDVIPYDGTATILREITKIATENLSNVKVVQPESEYRTFINCNGSLISLVHGDRDKMNSDDVLSKRSQVDHRIYDAIVGGHLHHSLIKENSGFILMAGSLVGNTDFSDSLGVRASRSQMIITIDDNGEITPTIIPLGAKYETHIG